MVAEPARNASVDAESFELIDPALRDRVFVPLAPPVRKEWLKLPCLRAWGLPVVIAAFVFTGLTHLMGAPAYIVAGLFACALAACATVSYA